MPIPQNQENITCTVTLTDPDGASADLSAQVSVQNSPPILDSISISPSVGFIATVPFLALPFTDPDIDILYFLSLILETTHSLLVTPSHWTSLVQPFDTSCVAIATDSFGGAGEGSSDINIDNSLPEITSIAVSPDPAYESDILSCDTQSIDIDGNSISLSYDWLVNGTSIGISDATLGGDHFDRGDLVQCSATPNDGYAAGTAMLSAGLSISNTPPQISTVFITPDPAAATDSLVCSYEGFVDDDGDADSSEYEWSVNGSVIASTSTLEYLLLEETVFVAQLLLTMVAMQDRQSIQARIEESPPLLDVEIEQDLA